MDIIWVISTKPQTKFKNVYSVSISWHRLSNVLRIKNLTILERLGEKATRFLAISEGYGGRLRNWKHPQSLSWNLSKSNLPRADLTPATLQKAKKKAENMRLQKIKFQQKNTLKLDLEEKNLMWFCVLVFYTIQLTWLKEFNA